MTSIPSGIRTLPNFPQAPREVPLPKPEVSGPSFRDTLAGFIDDVNQLQITADQKTQAFATGKIQNIHEVMTAAEEAGIAMQLLMAIRNKVVDAYHELMRTQI
jgi:flagellar hook-basal body complex protein FliE